MAHFSDAIYQLVSLIMSLLMSLGAITTPATDDVIRLIEDDTIINFVVTGDPQVCNYNPSRETSVISAAEDLTNSETTLDAFIIAGDIAENGFQDEFDRVYDDLHGINAANFIMAAGNHDIRLREYEQSSERFINFTNSFNIEQNAIDSLRYTYEVNGYKFIVMASDKSEFEEAYISSVQLEWLNQELKAASAEGKPVFVICHYPLAEGHGLPNTWGSANSPGETGRLPEYTRKDSYDFTGSIGEQSNAVYDIISKYKNVFFITGHLHTGFGKYTYEPINSANNVQGINVPSLGINNKDGTYNNPGTGMYVEVTPDEVIFYARDFANGKFLSVDEFSETIAVFPLI
ncbi:MAG: metallophosphoesterase [Clostridia bacterium]|nr:metallophosphoesterase [Clostridia bacterium]